MSAWITYTAERFPPLVYLLVVGGFVCSGALVGGGDLSALPTGTAAVGLLWFFFELRLMDERKDFDKDQIANPGRPLPRGLLTPPQVDRAIRRLALGMIGVAVLAGVATTPTAGGLFLLLTGYLWLMYREFYLGAWLVERPILYAASHQIVLLPMVAFVAACVDPMAIQRREVWATGLVSLGGFFAYEVCRKLDPGAHPVLRTYRAVYGASGTAGLVLAALALAAVGAIGLGRGSGWFLWPTEAVLAGSLCLLWLAPARYKAVEALASLSLLVHLWAGAIAVWGGGRP